MAEASPISEAPPRAAVCSLDIDTAPPDRYRLGSPSPSRLSKFSSKLHQIVAAKGKLHCLLLILSVLASLIGLTAGALLSRVYFDKGGNRKWISTWLQSSGWPLLALATAIIYWQQGLKPSPLNRGLAISYLLLGILFGFANFLYAWGIACLPLSTFSLLTSSQLAFNAIFAMLITRQRISAFGWNSIVLVTSSAIILAFHSNSDRLPGISQKDYIIGFIVTIISSALFGLFYPVTELVLKRYLGGRSTLVVLEMQVCYCVIATILATVGMAVNKDLRAMPIEAESFRAGGVGGYCLNLVFTAVSWQVGALGSLGVIYLSSSLLAGVVLSVGIPLGSISAVIVFGDSFGGLKVMSMLLSIWGFVSYIYGGYTEIRQKHVNIL